MISVNSSTVTSASNADAGSVQGGAAIAVLKKALNQDASSAEQLIAALPAPQLATSGPIGTQVNTFA